MLKFSIRKAEFLLQKILSKINFFKLKFENFLKGYLYIKFILDYLNKILKMAKIIAETWTKNLFVFFIYFKFENQNNL